MPSPWLVDPLPWPMERVMGRRFPPRGSCCLYGCSWGLAGFMLIIWPRAGNILPADAQPIHGNKIMNESLSAITGHTCTG